MVCVCVGYSKALVTMHCPLSHAVASTMPLYFLPYPSSLLLTYNIEAKAKNTAYVSSGSVEP
jgi:hypothetical protein